MGQKLRSGGNCGLLLESSRIGDPCTILGVPVSGIKFLRLFGGGAEASFFEAFSASGARAATPSA